MVNLKTTLVCGFMIMAVALPVQAEDDGWSGEVEAGLVNTSGNTDETTITSEADITRDWTNWRQNLMLRSRFSEQDDERTAERYAGSTRLDYKFNTRDSLFIRGQFEDDDFSGFEFETSTAVGYGRLILDQEGSKFNASAGAGYRFSKFDERDPEEGSQREQVIARFAGDFRYQLSDSAEFRQEAESEVSVDDGDAVSRLVSSLKANLNSALAMQLSYTLENNSNPPDGAANTDTITAVSLLYGF